MLVNHNSIIGINSITANGDQLYFYKEDGTDAIFNISNINVLNTSGVSTFAGLESTGDLVIGGNVSIAGTLTYEDVTNVDSVGLITARNGLHVTGGNVGIGTDSPSALLHLSGSAPIIKLQDNNNTGVSALQRIDAVPSTGGTQWFAGQNSTTTNDLYLYNVANANLLFGTNNTERLRITSGGNVGIGTDNPTSKIQLVAGNSVAADNGNIVTISSGDGTSGNLVNKLNFGVSSTNNYAWIQSVKPGTNTYPLLLNPLGGNVGIGSDNPERTLSVATNNPMIQIWGTGGNGKQWSIISSDDTTGAAAASRGGNFVIYDDTSGGLGDVLTLTGVGGSMGLGVQNPGAKLHVSGGNIKVDDGYGIDFSATGEGSGTMTSELLDDYEEGTFTPTYSDASGNSSTTVTGAFGKYVKVGKMVSCYGSFYQSGSPTGMVGTDELRITGLPFTSSSTGQNVGNITTLHSAFRQPTVRFTKTRLSDNTNYLLVLRDNGSPNLSSGTQNWEIPALVDAIDSVGANNCAVSFNITYFID